MKKIRFWIVLVSVGLAILASALAAAQSGGGYGLTWNTMDGGGGRSMGGVYIVQGTIGQADAGAMAGGPYTISGGFWPGSPAARGYPMYLPVVMRRD